MLSLRIAFRFLKSGKIQTILIIVGMGIAISVQVFVGLLLTSLQKSLVDQKMGNSPQITMNPVADTGSIRDWERMVDTIERFDRVKAVAVSASAYAFIRNDKADLPVLMRGFEFESADRIYNLASRIYEGRPYQSRMEVLVGRDLREELDIGLGDELTILSADGSPNTFTVSGFYDLGLASVNKSWILANLQTTQQTFNFRRNVTSIEMALIDVFAADMIADEIE